MSPAITAAIAEVTRSLPRGSWTISWYRGYAVVKCRTQEKEAIHPDFDAEGNLIGPRWGLSADNMGWDCTVITPEGEVIHEGSHHGKAEVAARQHFEKNNPAIVAGELAAGQLLDTPVSEIQGTVKVDLLEKLPELPEPAPEMLPEGEK